MHADPKSAKETDSLTVFFVLLRSACVKAARKMFVKSTLGYIDTNLIRLSLVFMFANWYFLSRLDKTALIGMRTTMTARPAKDAMPRYPNKK